MPRWAACSRSLLAFSLVFILAVPLTTKAQQAGKVYRVGSVASTRVPHREEALRRGLYDLGWIEGQNITTHEGGERTAENDVWI